MNNEMIEFDPSYFSEWKWVPEDDVPDWDDEVAACEEDSEEEDCRQTETEHIKMR